MMPRSTLLAVFIIVLFPVAATSAQVPRTLTPAQARDHLGEQATVCGKVVTARYAASARGEPTFLNLDEPYPMPIFTVIIWREQRARFGSPEILYRDKTICVTGKITSYRGDPQIEATDPKQITIRR